MEHWNIVKKLHDGTIIYRHPFAGTEAWYLPERKFRPSHTHFHSSSEPLPAKEKQDYCAFCPAHYKQATPEKSRIELRDGEWHLVDEPTPGHIFSKSAECRRIGNLYEIISTNYWKKNYAYELSAHNRRRQQAYLADPMGRDHVIALLQQKAKNTRLDLPKHLGENELRDMSEPFFGGSHELVIPKRHYVDGADTTGQLCSTGELTPEEHYFYIKLSCHAINSIYENNPFVTFVSVYTNWRRDAGASFEHLHRQVIGVDRLGQHLQNGLEWVRREPTIYQNYVNYVAQNLGFFLCENDHAVAFVDVGHTFSTVAIYAKSRQTFPCRFAHAELKGMSDIIHAVHAAFGPHEAVNEEWYYPPKNAIAPLPWHVLIKWRNHRHAGIESITEIYPDEYGPDGLKNILSERLASLRAAGKIGDICFGNDCSHKKISLNYHRSSGTELFAKT